jgi:DNA-binding IscR family transcriptional regulator
VVLARTPGEISILQVVEACQGLLTAQYCGQAEDSTEVCIFHRAMLELHEATVGTLSSWTLQDFLRLPASPKLDKEGSGCRMLFSGCEKYWHGSTGAHPKEKE